MIIPSFVLSIILTSSSEHHEGFPAHTQSSADRFDPAHYSHTQETIAVLTDAEFHSLDYEQQKAYILSLLPYDTASLIPNWEIAFEDSRATLRGLTDKNNKTIQIFVRDGDTIKNLTWITAHEIGHAVDLTHLDDTTRGAFALKRGYRPADHPWLPSNAAPDFATVAGDFAETFACYSTGIIHNQSKIGGDCDADDLAFIHTTVSRILAG